MPTKKLNIPQWAQALLTEESYLRVSHRLILLVCFIVNLSIGPAQICMSLLILHWLFYQKCSDKPFALSPGRRYVYVPLCGWIFAALVASFVGVDFGRAIVEFLKTSFYILAPLAIADSLGLAGKRPNLASLRMRFYLLMLVAGHCLAAFYNVLKNAFAMELPFSPPGPVTASGQLVLILFALLALLDIPSSSKGKFKGLFLSLKESALFIFGVLVLLVGVWPSLLPVNIDAYLASSAIIGGTLIFSAFYNRDAISRLKQWPALLLKRNSAKIRTLLLMALCLLVASFVINLKRGPWLGFSVALIVVGVLYSRRVILIAALGVGALLFSLQPIQDRVFQFAEHFTIIGGRQYMWELGAELIERYPLGVGLDNARVMQKLDPTLPELHRHMHSNLLNIAVETGWIGLMMFIWWIGRVINLGWGSWRSFASSHHLDASFNPGWILLFTAGLFGWQVAGSVEYNFGDGEIVLIAWLFLGFLFASEEANKNCETKA